MPVKTQVDMRTNLLIHYVSTLYHLYIEGRERRLSLGRGLKTVKSDIKTLYKRPANGLKEDG